MTTPTNNPAATGILTIVCPDRTGIVAAVSGFLAEHNGNIVDAQQHTDPLPNVLFMRIEFDPSAMDLPREEIGQALAPIGDRFAMRIGLRFTDEPCAMGIMVSREEHCMMDLLMRQRIGELAVRIPVIIGNHPHLAHLGEAFDVPFHVVPVTDANRSEAEATAIQILHDAGCHFVVLARYMQILSPLFLDAFPMAIINIHHGFLPAFAGARPYHQAAQRGVKLIGATSHYATEMLDDGPIIDQDVIRVSHRDSVEDLIRKGRDVERMVLARAVRAHAEDRVIVYGNRTVVFD